MGKTIKIVTPAALIDTQELHVVKMNVNLSNISATVSVEHNTNSGLAYISNNMTVVVNGSLQSVPEAQHQQTQNQSGSSYRWKEDIP